MREIVSDPPYAKIAMHDLQVQRNLNLIKNVEEIVVFLIRKKVFVSVNFSNVSLSLTGQK